MIIQHDLKKYFSIFKKNIGHYFNLYREQTIFYLMIKVFNKSSLVNILLKKIKKIVFNQFEFFFLINKNSTYKILTYLNKHSNTKQEVLTDLTAYDKPGKKKRFNLIYNTLSVRFNNRILLLTKTENLYPVKSITKLYKGANWYEREVWDMFGIYFYDHPDHRRILTDYGFRGYPLRKDFPLVGFVESIYSDKLKSIIKVPISFAQELREWTFN